MSDDDISGSMSHRQQLGKVPDQFRFFGEHLENYNIETTALHRKLQSKVEALRILRKELEKFRTERDQFKLMAETLQLRYSTIKRNSDFGGFGGLGGSKSSVAKLLHETRERNIKLTTEVEALKQKLSELQGDIEILRAKENRSIDMDNAATSTTSSKEELQWKQERANFICHLENLRKKNAQLAFDFKALIDEKEEIITERDAYKCKAHRLNHELFVALKANQAHPKFLDIDSIILENKYLHERIKNLDNEMELTKQSMNKYKTMLDSKRKKGITKLGSSSNDESILSHKQVKSILDSGIDLPTKTETIQDLKSLCLAVLDNLNDKNLALNHQKKTNKMLATKIAELEQRIQTLVGLGSDLDSACESKYAPSQLLLHGYCSSLVDADEPVGPGTIAKSTSNTTEESGTISSEHEESNKTCHGVSVSDECMSSLSSESARSVLSSEYGNDGGPFDLSNFTKSAMYAYITPSTTTDSGNNCVQNTNAPPQRLISSAIAKERTNDLKDLPPELAAMVQRALHELDMRDFDEVVGANADIGADEPDPVHPETDELNREEVEDDDTIN